MLSRCSVLLGLCCLLGCKHPTETSNFSAVEITEVFTDSVSIRAITFLDSNTLAFAGSNGIFGTLGIPQHSVRTNVQHQDTLTPSFRAVGHTREDFFMLSISNPALLYKTGDAGRMELVYTESGPGVFYDAMRFFDDQEGIAVGDAIDGCLSIIKTTDAGASWKKLPCSALPKALPGEGAFAASNGNIEMIGDKVWIATSAGRIYFSPDRGKTWQTINTPMASTVATQGIYAIDFYDERTGFAVGGDYTRSEANENTKMRTDDGGATWQIMAAGLAPGYKSCVQFVPGTLGEGIVAVGFTGISYSADGGVTWKSLSGEGFYTLRFLSENVPMRRVRTVLRVWTSKKRNSGCGQMSGSCQQGCGLVALLGIFFHNTVGDSTLYKRFARGQKSEFAIEGLFIHPGIAPNAFYALVFKIVQGMGQQQRSMTSALMVGQGGEFPELRAIALYEDGDDPHQLVIYETTKMTSFPIFR